MPDSTGHATQADLDTLQSSLKQSNDDRKRDKLRRKIVRQHEWRVQVHAQTEIAIREAQAALSEMGGEVVDLFEPDYSSKDMLHHYANMTLSR